MFWSRKHQWTGAGIRNGVIVMYSNAIGIHHGAAADESIAGMHGVEIEKTSNRWTWFPWLAPTVMAALNCAVVSPLWWHCIPVSIAWQRPSSLRRRCPRQYKVLGGRVSQSKSQLMFLHRRIYLKFPLNYRSDSIFRIQLSVARLLYSR